MKCQNRPESRLIVSKCKKINLIFRQRMFTFILESSAELYLNSNTLNYLSTETYA